MILCIDVGNSHLYGGVFEGEKIKFRFRHSTKASTSDELGVFLKGVLRENGCEPEKIKQIGLCSVVPQIDHSLKNACLKYFSTEPFVLQAGVKTGLNIKYGNPKEVGADRISNAIAALHTYPNQNLIVIDFGTATTFCAISSQKIYLGGAIMPGLRLSAEALSKNTAKLPAVEIVKPETVIGRSTVESIQSGVYFGMLGAAKELIQKITKEAFAEEKPLILATGGFASLFDNQNLFDHLVPDLVLHGIRLAALMNN